MSPADRSADIPSDSKCAGSESTDSQVTALQRAMWADGGLLRSQPLLLDGLQIQAETQASVASSRTERENCRQLLEAQSLCRVARAILCSALARNESRGAHFRNDYPKRNDSEFQKHSIYTPDGRVRFENL
ncbi:MAG: hypothetical protein JF563_03750 [Acidobacteriales bacterium]|nr:hypothetical protein [Terriglobales bacterium]